MEQSANHAVLRGALGELPAFSHENHQKRFYRFPLEVERLSGAVDVLPVLVSEQVLDEMDLSGGSMLEVEGQIRSFNNRAATGRRLVVSVYAQRLASCEGEPHNEGRLTGAIRKETLPRRTPPGPPAHPPRGAARPPSCCLQRPYPSARPLVCLSCTSTVYGKVPPLQRDFTQILPCV